MRNEVKSGASGCSACDGCQWQREGSQDGWCYMFQSAPDQLPCAQHDALGVRWGDDPYARIRELLSLLPKPDCLPLQAPQAVASTVLLCQKCGTKMELSEGWTPTYNDPDNAGMVPEAEPYCPKCDGHNAQISGGIPSAESDC
jgi:hypothetical protein